MSFQEFNHVMGGATVHYTDAEGVSCEDAVRVIVRFPRNDDALVRVETASEGHIISQYFYGDINDFASTWFNDLVGQLGCRPWNVRLNSGFEVYYYSTDDDTAWAFLRWMMDAIEADGTLSPHLLFSTDVHGYDVALCIADMAQAERDLLNAL